MQQSQAIVLAGTPQIADCITQIQNTKSQIKQKISQYFSELRKKMTVSIDKAQKSFLAKINDVCIASIDVLTRIQISNIDLSAWEREKYWFKTKKIMDKLLGFDVEGVLRGLGDELRGYVDKLRKIKILDDIPKITEDKELIRLQKTIKVEGQPIEQLLLVNKKLVQIHRNSVAIQKNTLPKKFDKTLAVKLNPTQSQKQILVALHNNTLSIYTDKLTLHSYRSYPYTPQNLQSMVQIDHYILIAQSYKITRINLKNLNEMLVRTFNQVPVVICSELYQGCVMVGFGGAANMAIGGNIAANINRVGFYELGGLEEVSVVGLGGGGRIQKIFVLKDSLVVVAFDVGIKVIRDFAPIQLQPWSYALKILQGVKFMDNLLAITNQSHVLSLQIQQINQNLTLTAKKVNQQFTKPIKNAVFKNYQIYCLSQKGNKIYVQSF